MGSDMDGKGREFAGWDEYGEEGLSLLDLLLVLARRKRLIFRVTALLAVAGIAASLLMTEIYDSSSRILNPVQKSSVLNLMEQQAGAVADLLSVGEKGNVYVSMLKSRNVQMSDFVRN